MLTTLRTALADYLTKFPAFILIVSLITAAAGGWYAQNNLRTNTNQDDLVADDQIWHQRYQQFLTEFGDQEYLVVMVETAGKLERAKTFIDVASKRFQSTPGIRQVLARVPVEQLDVNFLLYLDDNTRTQALEQLQQSPTQLHQLAQLTNMTGIVSIANQLLTNISSDAPEEAAQLAPLLPFFTDLLKDLTASAQGTPPQTTPLDALMHSNNQGQGITDDGYFSVGNGKYLLVLLMPEKRYDTLEVIAKPLAAIRDILETTRTQFPDLEAGLTGRPVLAADEMATTNTDMLRATGFALAAVALLLLFYFRNLREPVSLVVSLACGLGWTLAWTTWWVGSLNLLSSVFALILVAAGVEFGLHVLARYREHRSTRPDPRICMRDAIADTIPGNFTACLTTVAAFVGAILTDFHALRELGWIAAVGLLCCWVAMVSTAPSIVLLWEQRRTSSQQPTRTWSLAVFTRFKKVSIGSAVLLTIVASMGITKLYFDHNLLNLQADGLESVQWEHRLLDLDDISTWEAVSIVDTEAEIAQRVADLQALPSVAMVRSLNDLIPPVQDNALAQLKTAAEQFSIPEFAPLAKRVHIPKLSQQLTKLQLALENLHSLAEAKADLGTIETLEPLLTSVVTLRQQLRTKADIRSLAVYQQKIMEPVRGLIEKIAEHLTNPQAITPDQFPEALRSRFMSSTGRYAIYAYPTADIWDPAAMQQFITELRSVDPIITGVPVEVFEASHLLTESFIWVALFASIAIILLTLLSLRNLRDTAVALLPLACGVTWLLGIMGWANIPFTMANFFAIPILIGLGIDSGVQLLHRLRNDPDCNILATSTTHGIILTAGTVMASFGMLCTASHRGMQGLGLVMLIGSICILWAALTLVPNLAKRNEQQNDMPVKKAQ